MAQSVALDRYSFDLSAPLPAFNNSYATAYNAADDPDYAGGLYALVLNGKTPIRMDVLGTLEATRIGHLQTVVQHGVISIGGAERLALIIEKPRGEKLTVQAWPRFKDEELRQQIVKPLLQVMLALRERNLAHGTINPDALYITSGKAMQVTLAECVSTLPGVMQPALFEPLERAMCTLEGKGVPHFEDDMFALGVTTFLLALGSNPFAKLTPAQIIAARLEAGSSSFLLATAKVPALMMEIVRGLCADDAKARWSPNELENWIAGHRVSAKSTGAITRANRALNLNGVDYTQPRALAWALSNNPTAARALLDSKELPRWLARNVGDQAAAERLERLTGSGKSEQSNEVSASQIAMMIDPAAPVRYKKLGAMPSGLAGILSNAIIDKKLDVQQSVGEIIYQNLGDFWTALPGNNSPFNVAVARDMATARSYMGSNVMGAGLERLIYELDKGIPCLSEYFARRYVLSPKQFLLALDDVAGTARPAEVLDRHGAAWLAAHLPSEEHVFKNISAQRHDSDKNLAVLSLLAGIQQRTAAGPVPKLAAWLADLVKPALDRYNNRGLRNEIAKKIGKIAATGDLRALQQAVDNPKAIDADYQAFRQAAQNYQLLAAQIAETDVLLENKMTVGIMVGRRIAVIVATTVAGFAICASLASIL